MPACNLADIRRARRASPLQRIAHAGHFGAIRAGFRDLLILLVLLLASAGAVEAGAFNGLKLLVDTSIDSLVSNDKKVNRGMTDLTIMSTGETFQVELFVKGSAGKSTIGYNIQ